MTSNLLIGHSDITGQANKITSSATFDEDFNFYNLIGGPRYYSCALSSAGTTLTITYDLGSDYATKGGKLNYVALARADRLKANGLTDFIIQRSSDGSAWTTQYTNASMSSATLYGPRGDDYYDTPSGAMTPSTAYRYWRVTYTSSSQKFYHSKCYFGMAFDFGAEPHDIKMKRPMASEVRWYADSGTEYMVRPEEPVYTFDITWIGLTDDIVRDFFNKIVAYREEYPVFLMTTTDHAVLDSQRIIHCVLEKAKTFSDSTLPDRNVVQASFVELIG